MNNNPAEKAALKSLSDIYSCIDKNQSFLLEAGAGAGKTYSLNKALAYILEKKSVQLQRNNQLVACITYTNVAADNFKITQNNHPALYSGTIHSFCWGILQKFQKEIKIIIADIEPLNDLLEDEESFSPYTIEYDFGFRKKEESIIKIHHDDVITIMSQFLGKEKFIKYLTSIYPIILIDEYQDTNEQLVNSILENLIDADSSLLVGFFGDGWQKIYGNVCGEIRNEKLEIVKKESNFRSEKNIVDVLNRIRPDLPQNIVDPNSSGTVKVFTSNNWKGAWETRNHWQGSLPPGQAKKTLDYIRGVLEAEGWVFEGDTTKTLMLTHRVLGIEQGYESIVSIFRFNDSFVKKQDKHIAYFVDVIEPLREFFENKKYGEMFKLLGRRFPHIKKQSDKKKWFDSLSELFKICDTGTVQEVIDYIISSGKPQIDSGVLKRELDLNSALENDDELSSSQRELSNLRQVKYTEIRALARFISGYTPFSTQHGVKGDEFENVLCVFGRGWNDYNWNRFLELSRSEQLPPLGNEEFYERNRNLFYVAISRPIKNLTLLFTQQLSDNAIETLCDWFGKENIQHL